MRELISRAEQAEARERALREALERVLDWLSSFSMPPTATLAEKQEQMAMIEVALAATREEPTT